MTVAELATTRPAYDIHPPASRRADMAVARYCRRRSWCSSHFPRGAFVIPNVVLIPAGATMQWPSNTRHSRVESTVCLSFGSHQDVTTAVPVAAAKGVWTIGGG